jgi:hypothetical protein
MLLTCIPHQRPVLVRNWLELQRGGRLSSTRPSPAMLNISPQVSPEQDEPFDWLKTGRGEARRLP